MFGDGQPSVVFGGTDAQTHGKLAANNQSSTETSSVKRVLTRSIVELRLDKMRPPGATSCRMRRRLVTCGIACRMNAVR